MAAWFHEAHQRLRQGQWENMESVTFNPSDYKAEAFSEASPSPNGLPLRL